MPTILSAETRSKVQQLLQYCVSARSFGSSTEPLAMPWAIFNDTHTKAIDELLKSKSDRVIGVVGGAILDDTLRRTIAERFIDDTDIIRKVMRVNGPLGNTGPKIDILYLLNGNKPVRNAMYGISEVRNFLAHNLDAAFDTPRKELNEAIAKLKLHEKTTHYPHHMFNQLTKFPIEPINTNRDKFVVNLKLCLIALMRDRMSHKTFSNQPRTESDLRTELGSSKIVKPKI